MAQLKSRLRDLAGVESAYPHILSAYLRIREGGRTRDKECRIFLKNRAAEIESVLSGDGRARTGLRKELEVLEHVLSQDVPQGTVGLALFVRGGEVIERFDTQFAFEDQLAYRRVPHIAQLAFMDEELEPFAVVALDSRSAKIFDIALGVVGGAKAEITSDVHRRIHAGGWSQSRYQRFVDIQKREHLDDVAKALVGLVQKWNYKRIMLVGPDNTTSRFVEMLPANVRSRIIQHTAVDNHAGDKQVIEEALKYFARAENEEEAQKIQRVRVEIHSSGMAVAGVDNVLRCLNQGKIYELLLAHDFNEKGVECSLCGVISHGEAGRLGKCSACDAGKDKLKDVELREVLTRRSLQYGFKIEFVKLPEFRQTLGNAAALLYSPS